jgi:hypothetical protein
LSRLRGRAVQTLSPDSRNRVWGFFAFQRFVIPPAVA